MPLFGKNSNFVDFKVNVNVKTKRLINFIIPNLKNGLQFLIKTIHFKTEIGHNMQRSEWTFDGSGEVTVNIFSMHANQVLIGKDVIDQKWLHDQISCFSKFFSKQPTYESWKKDHGMALMTFAQVRTFCLNYFFVLL